MWTTFAKGVADAFKTFFNARLLERASLVVVILAAGFILIAVVLTFFRRVAKKRLSLRVAGIVEKTVKYVGVVVVLVNAAEAAGLDLSAALGAAGIVGIALGFAAQTSVSNIISGLFLFSEKTFQIGDVLQIDNMIGSIESVDLLSIKLRTFDNRLVRVPNETMIKSKIVNATRWAERRLDLVITLPPGTNMDKIETLLKGAAASVSAALPIPAPSFVLAAIDEAGMRCAFGVWFKKEDYDASRTVLLSAISLSLEKEGLKSGLSFASLWAFPDSP